MRRSLLYPAAISAFWAALSFAAPPATELRQTSEGWVLLRDGKPYTILGVGGNASRQLLKQLGANSFRTWDAENIIDQLDEAHRLGLTVTVGIWLRHERHGFDYNDPKFVAEQLDMVRRQVSKYKDHPAVLMWALGNEMEGERGDNAAIWSHIENCAAIVKSLDPTRPTMTVIAEIGGDKVANIHKLTPSIDIIGINSYAGASSLVERYKALGGTKPIVITEFGPFGTWEVEPNYFGARPQPTANQKAEMYRRHYQATVIDGSDIVLGSYAFLWGSKLELTYTWFGMFLPDGSKLPAVDVMAELWSGKPPANLSPVVMPLTVEGPTSVEPGATINVAANASDPEQDPLTYEWVLTAEVGRPGIGGDPEEDPKQFPDAVVATAESARITMPTEPGIYRLYVYVRDGKGSATTANVPLRVLGGAAAGVEPPSDPVVAAGRKVELPFVVYDDVGGAAPFAPSGWMGNMAAIRLDPDWQQQPHQGTTSIRVQYLAPDQFGGVVWQDPPNDWGDLPGGFDLTGARRLSFFARGETGGETVEFRLGVIGRDRAVPDTGSAGIEVQLTPQWKQYEIDLTGLSLGRIKTGFAWVVEGQGRPVTFYLDQIEYTK